MTAMTLIAGWCLAVAVALAGTPARSLPEGRILIRAAYSGALEQVTLPTLRREVVVPVPCERWQSGSGIAIVDERRVIWACGEAPSRLYLFDLESGSLVMVGEGNRPVYLPKHGKVLFRKSSGLRRLSLYMADLVLEPNPTLRNVIKVEDRLTRELTALPISDDEILIESQSHVPIDSPSADTKTFRLNVATMQREELPAFRSCSLESVWRTTARQVLCKPRDPNTFVVELDRWMLMNPDDGSTQPLPLRVLRGVGMTYVPEADAALLSIMENPHVGYDLWLYEFRSGKLTRLPPGPHAFSHDAVWIPARHK